MKFLNALFLGFLCLSLRAVFAKTAWQAINSALFLLFGYFACAQYDKFRLLPKFDSLPRFDFIKVRNDGKMASFGVEFMNFYVNFGEKFKKFKEFKGNKEIE